MKRILLTGSVFLLLFCRLASSQQAGAVEVIKDPEIDSVLARRLELSKSNTGIISGSGFRIEIFSGSDRQKAYAAQAKFKSLYPRTGAYLSYERPNYKVRIGDFRTKLEAEKLVNELKPYFPELFIFSERINIR